VFNERWNSLSLMMRRPMMQIALKLKLANDRQSNYKIDAITRTFALRAAIDTRNTHLVRFFSSPEVPVKFQPNSLCRGR